ncbi:MAG: hypothetical protein J6T80_04895 [Paludibacteraceae bacterium]|nr:hypothetical protein [Paludibacteraceae bacterium]
MSRRSLIWKIPLALVGVLSGVVLLLLITVTTVLCVPSWRTKALEKGVEIANEMTDYDIDLDGLVVRFDLGIGIHAPYQTYRYDKEGNPDPSQPIDTYFNMPSVLDALRLNFGIGYPF